MQNSLPPTSSGKVKFRANAILLLFNYQPAPGRWSSPDRFSFVRLHKAREAGLGGLQGLGENCSSGSTCCSCCLMGLSCGSHCIRLPGQAGEGPAAQPAPGTAGNAPATSRMHQKVSEIPQDEPLTKHLGLYKKFLRRGCPARKLCLVLGRGWRPSLAAGVRQGSRGCRLQLVHAGG